MKIMKRTFMLLGAFVLFCAVPFVASAWVLTHVLNVWSVDSGKHLDWSGSTAYSSNFTTGVNTWNAYKSGVIRKDGLLTVNDVTISDVSSLSGNTVALTTQYYTGSGGKSTSATIKFSTPQINNLTSAKRNIVCTHELGHTLGLDENNDSGSTSIIMYNNIANNTSNNVLHSQDKLNYDYMYDTKY